MLCHIPFNYVPFYGYNVEISRRGRKPARVSRANKTENFHSTLFRDLCVHIWLREECHWERGIKPFSFHPSHTRRLRVLFSPWWYNHQFSRGRRINWKSLTLKRCSEEGVHGNDLRDGAKGLIISLRKSFSGAKMKIGKFWIVLCGFAAEGAWEKFNKGMEMKSFLGVLKKFNNHSKISWLGGCLCRMSQISKNFNPFFKFSSFKYIEKVTLGQFNNLSNGP